MGAVVGMSKTDAPVAKSSEGWSVKRVTIEGTLCGNYSHDGDWVELLPGTVDTYDDSAPDLATWVLDNLTRDNPAWHTGNHQDRYAKPDLYSPQRIGPRVRITVEVLED